MTRKQKIQDFSSLDGLLEEIDADTQSTLILAKRYPIRFILLDNFDVFRELLGRFRQREIKSIDLENINRDEPDNMITRDVLMSRIRSLAGRVVVSPVSEIIRFYEDIRFRAFLEELALQEFPNDLSRRIYVPLIGLEHRFENFLSKFNRIQESAPIWRLGCGNTHRIKLFLVASDFSVPMGAICLKTFHDWLVFWRNSAPKDKVLSSSDCLNTFYSSAQPDNIFEIHRLCTGKSFIENFLGFTVPVEYDAAEETLWRELASKIAPNTGDNFREFVLGQFNSQQLGCRDIAKCWIECSLPFQRWLLKHFFLNYCHEKNAYLSEILKDISQNSGTVAFVERVALSIFESQDISIEKASMRKRLIDAIGSAWSLSLEIEQKLRDALQQVAENNVSLAVELCSGHCRAERELLVRWLVDGNLSFGKLQNIYPDLAAYLGKTKTPYLVFADYFEKYKTAKLRDNYTQEIDDAHGKLNKSETAFWEWYHSFPTTENLLAEAKVDKVYWIDGVGAEFLPLLVSFVRQSHDFQVEKAEIATVKLPSATAFNKPPPPHEKLSNNLDEFAHEELYKYPDSLVREIEIMRELIERICRQTTRISIAIVSDHGLTALSRLVPSRNYGWDGMSHEGRYAEFSNNGAARADSDYIVREVDGKSYRIALTHSSLGAKPVRETHGGCTPEEVLVPFIIISNKHGKINTPSARQDAVQKQPPVATHQSTQQTKGFEEEELF